MLPSPDLLDKRESRIRAMFGEIAPSYDLLNHLLSLNIDKLWRKRTTKLLPATTGPILDLCTGTGDLALAYDKATGGKIEIIGADFCHEMLVRGVRKATTRKNLHFIEADAQHLPFADNTFELVVVAFGLRNVTDPMKGLAEMVRVTRPGGKIGILEFSKPRHWFFGRAYRWYFRSVLPRIGQIVSGSKDSAYSYLPESVLAFPDGEALAEKMRQAGLTEVQFTPFTLGISTLYVGMKQDSISSTRVDERCHRV